jgi:nicotinamide-nucleotide amidase
MGRGACARLGVDLAVATTGIAGPTGATEGKLLGLTYIAIVARDGSSSVRRLTLPGNRDDVRRRAVIAALNLLWRYLDKEENIIALAR